MTKIWRYLFDRYDVEWKGKRMFLFSKENAYAIVRTFATFFYGWVLTLSPNVEELIADVGINQETFVLLFGAILYQAIRLLAEKFPFVGYLLIINHAPSYNDLTPPSHDTLVGDRDAPSQDLMEE